MGQKLPLQFCFPRHPRIMVKLEVAMVNPKCCNLTVHLIYLYEGYRLPQPEADWISYMALTLSLDAIGNI
ncbi:hypothetical protein AAG906_032797 [Vitis piasezkii]